MTPEYHDNVPDGKHWLLNHVPYYAKWYRFAMFWRMAEGILAAVKKDPAWNEQKLSISAENDELRKMFTLILEELCGEDKELLTKVTPQYPPGGKRILFDNGNWIRALRRDNVKLVTDKIAEINETGVKTADGKQYDADVLIYGTGFLASRFLWPMQVTGKSGADLQAQWNGDPRAYPGITIPNFPNLFCLYGPNTNIVVNGSIVFFSECEVRYVLSCIRILLEEGHAALRGRGQHVHDKFNKMIDEGNLNMAWGAATCPPGTRTRKAALRRTGRSRWSVGTRRAPSKDYNFVDAG